MHKLGSNDPVHTGGLPTIPRDCVTLPFPLAPRPLADPAAAPSSAATSPSAALLLPARPASRLWRRATLLPLLPAFRGPRLASALLRSLLLPLAPLRYRALRRRLSRRLLERPPRRLGHRSLQPRVGRACYYNIGRCLLGKRRRSERRPGRGCAIYTHTHR